TETSPPSLHDALPICEERHEAPVAELEHVHVKRAAHLAHGGREAERQLGLLAELLEEDGAGLLRHLLRNVEALDGHRRPEAAMRSEEHTSELQSRGHL